MVIFFLLTLNIGKKYISVDLHVLHEPLDLINYAFSPKPPKPDYSKIKDKTIVK